MNVSMTSVNSKGLLFVLRNPKIYCYGKQVKIFSQKYLIHQVSRWGLEESIYYLVLTTGSPR
jgi:hypothetical protein